MERYARQREQHLVPVQVPEGVEIRLSPGEHSELIRLIIEDFGSRFVPGGSLVYVGDTGNKWVHFDEEMLARLGVRVDTHGKMPDVVIYDENRDWLVLVESVTSHGPVDGKRHEELASLFGGSTAGLVYVTAFPSRATMTRFLSEISWESEVWVAEAPEHCVGSNHCGPREAVR